MWAPQQGAHVMSSLLRSAHNYVQNLCTITEVHHLAAHAANLLLAEEAAELAAAADAVATMASAEAAALAAVSVATVDIAQERAQDASSTSGVTDEASTSENVPGETPAAQEAVSPDPTGIDPHLISTFGVVPSELSIVQQNTDDLTAAVLDDVRRSLVPGVHYIAADATPADTTTMIIGAQGG